LWLACLDAPKIVVTEKKMFGKFGLRKTREWNNEPKQQELIRLIVAAAQDSSAYSALTKFIIQASMDWSPSETRDRLAHAISYIKWAVERDVYKRAKEIGRDFTLASYRLGKDVQVSRHDPRWVPPAARQPAATLTGAQSGGVAERKAEIFSPSKSDTDSVLTESGKWRTEPRNDPVHTEEISRTYHFSGIRGSNATLRIVCIVQLARHDRDSLSFEDRIRFYLEPMKEEEDTVWVMGISKTDDSQGRIFHVLARPVEGETDTVVIAIGDREDAVHCLDAIKSGGTLSLSIGDAKETLIDIQLPNDRSFKQLYDQVCNRLRDCETGLQFSDDIRGNSKGYAIWTYERSSGEFAVLLVKLDSKGNMAESWTLGTFESRSEQETRALEIARDLQIESIDVDENHDDENQDVDENLDDEKQEVDENHDDEMGTPDFHRTFIGDSMAANEPPFNARDLLALCTSQNNEVQTFCNGWLIGLVMGMESGRAALMDMGKLPEFLVPKDITGEKLRLMLKSSLERAAQANQNIWNIRAEVIVFGVLGARFPAG
jgi:hypothetical protein